MDLSPNERFYVPKKKSEILYSVRAGIIISYKGNNLCKLFMTEYMAVLGISKKVHMLAVGKIGQQMVTLGWAGT